MEDEALGSLQVVSLTLRGVSSYADNQRQAHHVWRDKADSRKPRSVYRRPPDLAMT